MKYRYSVAAGNDDIEDFDYKKPAVAYAKRQAQAGKQHVIINVMTADGDYLDCIKADQL